MKSGALALALLVSAVQTVGWVECCCFMICKHRDAPCGDCKKPVPVDAERRDCCKTSGPQHRSPEESSPHQRCQHVEPSGEVIAHAADLPVGPPTLIEFIDPAAVVSWSPGLAAAPEFAEPRGSPPLHLLHSVLLI